jgi:hypothetical protein
MVIGLLLAAAPLAAQETSLTVYADGFVTVRRAHAQPVARGAGTVAVDPGTLQLDPASIVLTDDGAELRGARLVQAAGAEAALRRSPGRDVDFWVQPRDTAYFVRGRVLSLQPPAARVFSVPVPARTDVVLEYRVRARW